MLRQLRLARRAGVVTEPPPREAEVERLGAELAREVRARFGRSLHIRQVDAGSCNGCELEIGGLTGPHYDLERFGLHFVADFMLDHSWWLRLAGGVLMVGIGVYELLRPLPEPGRRRPITVNSIAGWYGTTFLLTITNPIAILSFGAVFMLAEAVVPQGDLSAAWTLIAGVFCGSALWFGSLSGFSRMFRRGIDVQGLRLVSRVSGVAVILFGVVVLLSLTPVARRTFGY